MIISKLNINILFSGRIMAKINFYFNFITFLFESLEKHTCHSGKYPMYESNKRPLSHFNLKSNFAFDLIHIITIKHINYQSNLCLFKLDTFKLE